MKKLSAIVLAAASLASLAAAGPAAAAPHRHQERSVQSSVVGQPNVLARSWRASFDGYSASIASISMPWSRPSREPHSQADVQP